MGAAASMDHKTIVSEVEKKYIENPDDTAKLLRECESRVKQLKMKEAIEYARQKAQFALPTEEELSEIWKIMDYNGNNILSLAEIDKFVVERFPRYNNKPALMRAYKAADVNGDGYITRDEFTLLFSYLQKYNLLWAEFTAIDKDGDRRIDIDEFTAMCETLFGFKPQYPKRIFNKFDKNKGGKILFSEFCDYMVRNHKITKY